MGIRRLEISGFRSLADVVWEPGPLNVLIGANGSGKSNLLRALDLLRAAAEGKLSETVLRAGGMVPLLWDGQVHNVDFRVFVELASDDDQQSMAYVLKLEQLGQSGGYRVGEERVVAIHSEHEPAVGRTQLRRDGTNVTLRVAPDYKPTGLLEHESYLAQAAAIAKAPTLGMLHGWLVALRVYHDVRVDSEAEIRRATIARLETKIDQDGTNLVAVLHTLHSDNRDFREALNQAMRAAFGGEFEELLFPPAEDGRVQLRLRWRSLKRAQSAADLSDGTLRFLFLITVLANPTPPSLVAIDEPETGLHPSMLPIVAEYAVEASKRTQVILTTHSPQFLNAFSEHPDITTVAESHEGKTVLRRLPADKLAKWLEHYQLGELMMSGELETMS